MLKIIADSVKITVLLAITFISVSQPVKAQFTFNDMAFFLGYALDAGTAGGETRYRPYLFSVRTEWDVNFIKFKKHKAGQFYILNETQVNVAFILGADGLPIRRVGWDYEFGTHPGIGYKYSITDQSALKLDIIIGPHYISADAQRQNSGFIFSDNFSLGWEHLIDDHTHIEFIYRWRHISNAGLQEPNGGINNNLLMISLGIRL